MPWKDPEKNAAYQRERMNRREAAGLCRACPRRAKADRTLCEVCLLKATNRKKRRRLLKAEAGLCVVDGCAKPAAPGHKKCDAHRRYFKVYYAGYGKARRKGGFNGNLAEPPVDPTGDAAVPDRRAQPHEPPGPGHVRPDRT